MTIFFDQEIFSAFQIGVHITLPLNAPLWQKVMVFQRVVNHIHAHSVIFP